MISKINPVFYTKAGALLIGPPGLNYDVDRYTRHAIGGPKRAQIDCYGSDESLWQLGTLMRSPVELIDDNADLCWHGYIHAVRINVGGVEWGLSIDDFANRVAVAYTAASGTASMRKTTAFATDSVSVAEFGTKDYLHPMNNATDASAVQQRDIELSIRKNFIPTIEVGDTGQSKGTILMRGWWDTLSWRLTSSTGASGSTSYAAEPEDSTIEFGTPTQPQCAQGFIVTGSGSLVVTKIRVKCVRVVSPADDVLIDIMTGDASAPGSVVGTATLAGTSIGTSHEWKEWTTFTTQAVITAGSQYCLRFRRSGSTSAVNYYRVAKNTALGYSSGVSRAFDGTSWIVSAPDADVLFEVFTELVSDTTEQMATMIGASGQFFSGAVIETASNMYTVPTRNGDTTALLEVEKLMEVGSSTGLRYLADVSRDRIIRIFTEPSSALPYALDRHVTLRSSFGDPIPVHKCPAGIWTKLIEPMPGALNFTGLSFIEEAEYSARTGTWRPLSRRTRNPMRGNKWQ